MSAIQSFSRNSLASTPMTNQAITPWWRGGVIYQVYPRSFMDSNRDGIGDINGIRKKLPYIASIGVEAIWISPFYPSPMKDFGYDVTDYVGVDPIFGTLNDFRMLLKEANALGVKVIIDLVLSHTSDLHPWFVESRSKRVNPKADWYVWADAREDGCPPNNWLSIFGGSAWAWDTRRCQYYLHNFLTSQPDLNFHNPQVQDAVLAVAQFWLEQGVHGFRLDTVNFYFHDQSLCNNPGRGVATQTDAAFPSSNPYAWQYHIYDKSQPQMLPFLSRLRQLTNRYVDTGMIGEIGCDQGLKRAAEYTLGRERLHMAYGFDLLGPAHDAPYLYETFRRFLAEAGNSWLSWSLSNHDVKRIASRWGKVGEEATTQLLGLALLLALRGSPCLYQGDELGVPEDILAFEHLRDPYGITMWPEFPGRDGCRTPFPWRGDEVLAGFTEGTTSWLPVSENHRRINVAAQEVDAHSVLNVLRQMIRIRKAHPSLTTGDMKLLSPHAQIIAFERSEGSESTLCLCNMSYDNAVYTLPISARVLMTCGQVAMEKNEVKMSPRSGAWFIC